MLWILIGRATQEDALYEVVRNEDALLHNSCRRWLHYSDRLASKRGNTHLKILIILYDSFNQEVIFLLHPHNPNLNLSTIISPPAHTLSYIPIQYGTTECAISVGRTLTERAPAATSSS